MLKSEKCLNHICLRWKQLSYPKGSTSSGTSWRLYILLRKNSFFPPTLLSRVFPSILLWRDSIEEAWATVGAIHSLLLLLPGIYSWWHPVIMATVKSLAGPGWSRLVQAGVCWMPQHGLIRLVLLSCCCLFPLWQSELISTKQPEMETEGQLLCTSIHAEGPQLCQSFTHTFHFCCIFSPDFIQRTRPRWSDTVEWEGPARWAPGLSHNSGFITQKGAPAQKPSRPRPCLIFAFCHQISNELGCAHGEVNSVFKHMATPLSHWRA